MRIFEFEIYASQSFQFLNSCPFIWFRLMHVGSCILMHCVRVPNINTNKTQHLYLFLPQAFLPPVSVPGARMICSTKSSNSFKANGGPWVIFSQHPCGRMPWNLCSLTNSWFRALLNDLAQNLDQEETMKSGVRFFQLISYDRFFLLTKSVRRPWPRNSSWNPEQIGSNPGIYYNKLEVTY